MKHKIILVSGLALLFTSPAVFAQGGPVPVASNKVLIVTSSANDSSSASIKGVRIGGCRGHVKSGHGPLYVIDGLPYFGEIPKSLNPNDIAKIDILKGARATALYGTRATEGAILITTKQ